MKKILLSLLLAGSLAWTASAIPAFATKAGTADESPVPTINPDNYVDVEAIDLSLHSETTGEFTPVYSYENPFLGKDTSQGVILEFYAKPTWEVHVLGTIFAFSGSGDYDGKFYFTPGSYLGFNSAPFGGFFDANLFNYSIVDDYIQDGAKIRIEVEPSGFFVYANDTLCYDQSILADETRASGDFTADSDFSSILEWLAGADTLSFGYGSWWNTVGDTANVLLSQVNFRLKDGTVVMDQLKADKVLVEYLGGSVDAPSDNGSVGIALENVNVDLFDINSVHYDGRSAVPVVVVGVIVVAAIAAVVVLAAVKERTYDDY